MVSTLNTEGQFRSKIEKGSGYRTKPLWFALKFYLAWRVIIGFCLRT